MAKRSTPNTRPSGGAADGASGSSSSSGSSSAGRSPAGPSRRADVAARQARIEAARKAQQRRERRTVLLIVGACAALVVLLGGVVAYGIYDARRNSPENLVLTIGVPAAGASCDAITDDPATGNGEHVGAGTPQPNVKKVSYSTVPPTSGAHFVSPALDGRQFYTLKDTPAVETLVHNMEHGYTILWYLPAAAETRRDQLAQLASVGNKLVPSQGKFIVAPWNEAYGAFPAGKNVALSHWSATTDAQGKVTAQTGHRQLCGDLSGEAVTAFVTKFPKTDAPEPAGA